MLQKLRQHSGKWFFKALFVAIIASFVLFGLPEIIRSYQMGKPVARVGSQKISPDLYAAAIRKEINRIQSLLKTSISPQQIKEFKIHENILEEFITKFAIKEEIEKLKIIVPESLIRSYIYNISAFHEGGKFDKNKFVSLLRDNGMSEGMFLKEVSDQLAINILTSPLNGNLSLPKTYLDLLSRLFTENHLFTTASISFDRIKISKTPSIEELKIHHSQRKESYLRPESRKISVLEIGPSIAKNILVSPEDLKNEYHQRKDEFQEPEKRAFESVTYPTRALAEQALRLIKEKNLSFPQVVNHPSAPLGKLDQSSSPIPQDQFPTPAQKATFAAKVNEITDIIYAGEGQYTIYKVTEITPSRIKSFEEVKSQILKNIQEKRFEEEFKEMRRKIEDAIGAGRSLQEIGKEFKIAIKEIALKKDQATQAFKELGKDVQKIAFEESFQLSKKQISQMIEVAPGTFILIQVDSITPSYIPGVKEIEQQLREEWRIEQKKKKAQEFVENFKKKGKTLPEFLHLAKEQGFTVERSQKINRLEFEEALGNQNQPSGVIAKIGFDSASKVFTAKKNQQISGFIEKDQKTLGMTVIYHEGIEEKNSSKPPEKLTSILLDLFGKDLQKLLIKGIVASHKTVIDHEILEQVKERTH